MEGTSGPILEELISLLAKYVPNGQWCYRFNSKNFIIDGINKDKHYYS